MIYQNLDIHYECFRQVLTLQKDHIYYTGIYMTSHRFRLRHKTVLTWVLWMNRNSSTAGTKILDCVGSPLLSNLKHQAIKLVSCKQAKTWVDSPQRLSCSWRNITTQHECIEYNVENSNLFPARREKCTYVYKFIRWKYHVYVFLFSF